VATSIRGCVHGPASAMIRGVKRVKRETLEVEVRRSRPRPKTGVSKLCRSDSIILTANCTSDGKQAVALCAILPLINNYVKSRFKINTPFTRYSGCQTGCTTGLTFSWLSDRFDNRFDNRLYRVNGA